MFVQIHIFMDYDTFYALNVIRSIKYIFHDEKDRSNSRSNATLKTPLKTRKKRNCSGRRNTLQNTPQVII